jgi:hypothetical protein
MMNTDDNPLHDRGGATRGLRRRSFGRHGTSDNDHGEVSRNGGNDIGSTNNNDDAFAAAAAAGDDDDAVAAAAAAGDDVDVDVDVDARRGSNKRLAASPRVDSSSSNAIHWPTTFLVRRITTNNATPPNLTPINIAVSETPAMKSLSSSIVNGRHTRIAGLISTSRIGGSSILTNNTLRQSAIDSGKLVPRLESNVRKENKLPLSEILEYSAEIGGEEVIVYRTSVAGYDILEAFVTNPAVGGDGEETVGDLIQHTGKTTSKAILQLVNKAAGRLRPNNMLHGRRVMRGLLVTVDSDGPFSQRLDIGPTDRWQDFLNLLRAHNLLRAGGVKHWSGMPVTELLSTTESFHLAFGSMLSKMRVSLLFKEYEQNDTFVNFFNLARVLLLSFFDPIQSNGITSKLSSVLADGNLPHDLTYIASRKSYLPDKAKDLGPFRLKFPQFCFSNAVEYFAAPASSREELKAAVAAVSIVLMLTNVFTDRTDTDTKRQTVVDICKL